jgi:hypothetical protein
MNMKECRTCGQSKELPDFPKDKQAKGGIRATCTACYKERKRIYRLNNKARMRDYHLQATYGLTPLAYKTMYEAQEGCCKICSIKEKHAPNQRLCVDHDHDTGAVRGLLCGKCNSAIGLLQDSSEFTIKATTYLQDNGK